MTYDTKRKHMFYVGDRPAGTQMGGSFVQKGGGMGGGDMGGGDMGGMKTLLSPG